MKRKQALAALYEASELEKRDRAAQSRALLERIAATARDADLRDRATAQLATMDRGYVPEPAAGPPRCAAQPVAWTGVVTRQLTDLGLGKTAELVHGALSDRAVVLGFKTESGSAVVVLDPNLDVIARHDFPESSADRLGVARIIDSIAHMRAHPGGGFVRWPSRIPEPVGHVAPSDVASWPAGKRVAHLRWLDDGTPFTTHKAAASQRVESAVFHTEPPREQALTWQNIEAFSAAYSKLAFQHVVAGATSVLITAVHESNQGRSDPRLVLLDVDPAIAPKVHHLKGKTLEPGAAWDPIGNRFLFTVRRRVAAIDAQTGDVREDRDYGRAWLRSYRLLSSCTGGWCLWAPWNGQHIVVAQAGVID